MATRNEYVSFHPVHPGEILKEELEERGMSNKELSVELGISPQNVSDYINGRRNFTTDFSCKLEKILGINARFWMNLQTSYEITKRRVEGLSSSCQKALEEGTVPIRIMSQLTWRQDGKYLAVGSLPGDEERVTAEGATLEEAKNKFEKKIESLSNVEEGHYFVEWTLSSSALLQSLPIELSKVSELSGIGCDLLSSYKSGQKKPGKAQVDKLQQAVNKFADELLATSLSV